MTDTPLLNEGPSIAAIAALIGDPARANMLTALLDARALTVTELAQAGGVGLPTASGHLAKLQAAGLLTAEKQGRHRYLRLSGPDVGWVLEELMALAQRTGAVRVRTGPKDAALRQARVCYDHLAGERGVALMAGLLRRGVITDEATPVLTDHGETFLGRFGLDVQGMKTARRPVCRRCLDWSERRDHLGGSLGAALLGGMIEAGWVSRAEGRVLRFSARGAADFERVFA